MHNSSSQKAIEETVNRISEISQKLDRLSHRRLFKDWGRDSLMIDLYCEVKKLEMFEKWDRSFSKAVR